MSTEVNATLIEQQLSEIWKQMAAVPQKEKESPVMRARVLNLVVYAPGERSEQTVTDILADLTEQHPSRIVVMMPGSESTEPSVAAWVNALCHLSAGGRKQICCEQIMVRASEKGITQLPGLVRSLQVPDLPAVLWWRGNLDVNENFFKEFVEISDRIILDSSTFQNPESEFLELWRLVQSEIQWTAFSDLNWARLTPWRSAISGFFDIPNYRSYLNLIERIEIDCERNAEFVNIPGQAFLIAGWFASRLNWKLKSKPTRAGQDRFSMELTSDKGTISLRIHVRQTGKRIPGIHRISLFEEDHPTADFSVSRSEDGQFLKTNVELSGKSHAGRLIRIDAENETNLICKELEILGHDTVYEQTLAFLGTLGGLAPL